MIALYDWERERAYDKQDLQVFSSMASQAAIAIDNIRLVQQQEERGDALELLNQVSEKINAILNLNEVMASIVEGAMRLTGASSGVVHLLKENELSLERSFGYPKGFEHPVPRLDQPDSMTRTIIEDGELIFRQKSEEYQLHSEIVKEGVESIIGAPLILQGVVVGVLYLNFDHQYSFGEEVRTWLDTLTEQAAVATDKIRLYETLEEKVRERTRQLEIANRQAHEREILTVLGEVSAGLIHKMSNTIGHVPTLTNRVERSIDSRETDAIHKLHQIRDGVSDALEYIGSLGKILELQKITKAEADPSLLISDSIRQTREIIKSNSIELVEDYDGLPTVFVNSTLLIEVFRNIIQNAVEAMPSGGQLGITGAFTNDKISIQISDTGCGIVEENIPKLFSPGFSTKKEGKGIGLWFSKTVIEQHQGTISVKSENDKGTIFLITLPVGSPNDSVEYAEQEVSNV
jgi:signal transduction histidine kinase